MTVTPALSDQNLDDETATFGDGLVSVDDALRERIARLSHEDPDFWSFSSSATRDHSLSYFQYPAMMVPNMQRALLRQILDLQPQVRSVLDPFAGSGTVLTEGMRAGLSVWVQDINPLAVLLCKTKAGPLATELARERACDVQHMAEHDQSRAIEADFPSLSKWFQTETTVVLSRLRRAIRAVPELWIRRLLWVTLAETIRLTSNSRTSTFKLHIRPTDELSTVPRPLPTFSRLIERNLERQASFAAALVSAGHLRSTLYAHATNCRLADARVPLPGSFELLVTSPPYGDNRSTVPYGQSSYLALQWIDLADIDPSVTPEYIKSTGEIDTQSLGGRIPRGDLWTLSEPLRERVPSLHSIMTTLASQPRDRAARVYSFMHDLEQCITPLTNALRDNAYLVWTVGNRRVGGAVVPLDHMLTELLAEQRVCLVTSVDRRIPSKRMATRNQIAATMRAERILIYRKQPECSGSDNHSV